MQPVTSEERKMGSLGDWLSLFVATTGFTGLIIKNGKGAGTIGAAVALVVQIFMYVFDVSFSTVMVVAVISFIFGLMEVNNAEAFMRQRYGATRRRHDGTMSDHDFNQTNIDEFHGQMLAGAIVFWLAGSDNRPFWTGLIFLFISFGLFRFFDIKKPGPIGVLEKRYDGTAFGLMVDDTLAGVFAAILTGLAWWGFHWLVR